MVKCYQYGFGSSPRTHLSSCCQTPLVCASTPSTESNRTTAPSITRLALSTSIPKSACPGVSMRLNVQSFHLTGILADWTVIPRSRSTGKKSVVVLPVSTEPEQERYEVVYKTDSVSVVFPESMRRHSGGCYKRLCLKTDLYGPRRPCSSFWTHPGQRLCCTSASVLVDETAGNRARLTATSTSGTENFGP